MKSPETKLKDMTDLDVNDKRVQDVVLKKLNKMQDRKAGHWAQEYN